jgi:hypothetical protein
MRTQANVGHANWVRLQSVAQKWIMRMITRAGRIFNGPAIRDSQRFAGFGERSTAALKAEMV